MEGKDMVISINDESEDFRGLDDGVKKSIWGKIFVVKGCREAENKIDRLKGEFYFGEPTGEKSELIPIQEYKQEPIANPKTTNLFDGDS